MTHLCFSLLLAAYLAIGAIGGDSKKDTCPTAENVTATIIQPQEIVEYKHYLVGAEQRMRVNNYRLEALYYSHGKWTLINNRLVCCITHKVMCQMS